MRPHARIFFLLGTIGAICIITVGAILLSNSKAAPPSPDAVKFLSTTPRIIQNAPETNAIWEVTVLLSNTTPRTLDVPFPTVQTGAGEHWTNLCDPIDPAKNYTTHMRPHRTAAQAVEYLGPIPAGPWRLSTPVAQEASSGRTWFVQAQRYLDGVSTDEKVWSSRRVILSEKFAPVTNGLQQQGGQ